MEKMTLGFRSAWHWTFICVLLTWGLVVNCWGLEPGWEVCYSKSLNHAFELTKPEWGYLGVVGCPPGVPGTCFGAGPKMKKFNNKLYKDRRCEGAENTGLKTCDSSPGDVIICSLMYETYTSDKLRYIHSSNPPGIIYIKRKKPSSAPVPPPPPHGASNPQLVPQPTSSLNTVPSQAEKDALILKLSNLYVTRWKKHWETMTHGASGYAIFPAGVKDKLCKWVQDSTYRSNFYIVEQIWQCCDPWVMADNLLPGVQRGAGIDACFNKYQSGWKK